MPAEMSSQSLQKLSSDSVIVACRGDSICGVLRAGYRSVMRCRKSIESSTESPEAPVLVRYAAELKAIADLDREYYLNPLPNLADRASYYKRQEDLERIRQHLYSELCPTRHGEQSTTASHVRKTSDK